jgi:hypothetical protein
MVCGRHVGKTETANVVPADYALTHADADVLIAARFQETSDELFRRTKQHLSALGSLPEIGVTSPNSQTYEFDNGAPIMSRTLGHDARQQRGKVPECIIVEKAALVDRDVFDKVLRPMFATHNDYELWLISTPRGKSGYLYDKHVHSDG